jgi:hypothetical protein
MDAGGSESGGGTGLSDPCTLNLTGPANGPCNVHMLPGNDGVLQSGAFDKHRNWSPNASSVHRDDR